MIDLTDLTELFRRTLFPEEDEDEEDEEEEEEEGAELCSA